MTVSPTARPCIWPCGTATKSPPKRSSWPGPTVRMQGKAFLLQNQRRSSSKPLPFPVTRTAPVAYQLAAGGRNQVRHTASASCVPTASVAKTQPLPPAFPPPPWLRHCLCVPSGAAHRNRVASEVSTPDQRDEPTLSTPPARHLFSSAVRPALGCALVWTRTAPLVQPKRWREGRSRQGGDHQGG